MINLLELSKEKKLRTKITSGVSESDNPEFCSECPACGGKDRFRMWPKKQNSKCIGSYWCRKCGIKGDSIQFCMDFLGKSYSEAFSLIGKIFDKSSRKSFSQHPIETGTYYPSEKWINVMDGIVEKAEKGIRDKKEVLSFLKKRGIPGEAVKKYRLGWLENDIYFDRSQLDLTTRWVGKDAEMFKDPKLAGLLARAGRHNKPFIGKDAQVLVSAGLVIPEFHMYKKEGGVRKNPDGSREYVDTDTVLGTIKVKVRRKGRKSSKYLNVVGSKKGPYILNEKFRGKREINDIMTVVESELDAIAIDHALEGNVLSVAMEGSTRIPDRCVDGYAKEKRLIVICDNDERGVEMGEMWKDRYQHAELFFMHPQYGRDVGEGIENGFDIKTFLEGVCGIENEEEKLLFG
jgi:DNA primase